MRDPRLEQAESLSREGFIARNPGFFLLKRAKMNAPSVEAPQFGFATVATKMEIDPFAHEWQVFPVIKRAENPFPERLTIGRAPNNDIVLRVPFVSKVHAHILIGPDGSFRLRDNRVSHGTFHNGKRIAPGEECPLSLGDVLGFGSLELELVGGSRLHDILTTEAR